MNKSCQQAWSRSVSPALPVLTWLLLACLLAFQSAAPQTPIVDPLQVVQEVDGGALALDAVPRHEASLRQQQRLPEDPDDQPGPIPASPLASSATACPAPASAQGQTPAPACFHAAPLNSRAPPRLA